MTDQHLERVVAFYEQQEVEDGRLETDIGRLEVARVHEVMARVLPPAPARILDVGGGTGRYASDLAALGYEVALIDPVPGHVTTARERAAAGPAFSAEIGDARALESADASVDVVLLFGPLYHLPDPRDRRQALLEARRVLRPGGLLIAMVITSTAGALHPLRGDFVDTHFGRIGYFHDPSTVGPEAADAGFSIESVLGLEGPAWLFDDLAARWDDPVRRERILEVARDVEGEPSMFGASPHLLLVARKPG